MYNLQLQAILLLTIHYKLLIIHYTLTSASMYHGAVGLVRS